MGKRTGTITILNNDPDVSSFDFDVAAFYCPSPTEKAQNITFEQIYGNNLRISWQNGGGIKRLVVLREGSPTSDSAAEAGKVYNANQEFRSSVSNVLDGGKVVYNGSANTVTVFGI